jgi:uncharacterized membrane protein YfcA
VLIGVWLLVRGLLYPPKIRKPTVIAPLGLVGGFLDAAGGGGWGPVVTSNLLVQGAEPRKVVGTVNSVEFFLALTVSATFIWHLGFAQIVRVRRSACSSAASLAAPLGAIMAKRFSAEADADVMVGDRADRHERVRALSGAVRPDFVSPSMGEAARLASSLASRSGGGAVPALSR